MFRYPSVRSFTRRGRSPSSKRGFALLITVTLLAFLVLLLVSLASLTRVETQIASNNQHLVQARQNALFALNIALGQLQKAAGPDQRITARAEVGAGTIQNPLWTGVWGRTSAPDAYLTAANPSTATTGAVINWLISGNRASLNIFLFTGPDEKTEATEKSLSTVATRNNGKFNLLTTKRLEELTRDKLAAQNR